MTKVEVELDDETARRLRAGAEAQGRTFDEFLREQIASLPAARDPFRALNWDDDRIDRILDDTMTARETRAEGVPT
jgi:hypothetical protein